MIFTYGYNHFHYRGTDHISSIGISSHAGLQHYYITVLIHKMQKCHGCLHLKNSRYRHALFLHPANCQFYFFHIAAYRLTADIFLIYLNPLPIRKQSR